MRRVEKVIIEGWNHFKDALNQRLGRQTYRKLGSKKSHTSVLFDQKPAPSKEITKQQLDELVNKFKNRSGSPISR